MTVLDSLKVLFDLGNQPQVRDHEVIRALEAVGVVGFSEDNAGYLAMSGIVLRLLLRHAHADPDLLFQATRSDLEVLGRDIDDHTFESIARNLRSDP